MHVADQEIGPAGRLASGVDYHCGCFCNNHANRSCLWRIDLITMQTDLAFGESTFGESIFMGFLIALSSTAIVLKLIQERAEIDSPHGRTTLGILLFQDIIIVPMMLLTPLLAGATGNLGESLLVLVVKGIGIILLVVLVLVVKGIGIILLVAVGAKWVVPRALYQIARTRSRELFLLSIFMICLAVVWLTSSLGL